MGADENMFGAIEGGGTKFICAVGNGPDDLTLTEFPTEAARGDDCACSCISAGRAGTRLQAVGIGSFGPVDLYCVFSDIWLHHFHPETWLAELRFRWQSA